jgi:DNA-binding transcriptional LysR family regulator
LELRHLRYAVAVAEERSFTRAAARLRVAQQALSQQIADLERELQVRLFDRTGRGVQATPAGALFIDEARATLGQSERAVARTRARARSGAGGLRVAIAPSFRACHAVAGAVVASFQRHNPGIELEVVPVPSAGQLQALNEGRLDVVIGHVGPDALPSLGAELLWEESWNAVLLPLAHPLARQRPLWLRDLADVPMLGFPRELDPAMLDRIVAGLADRGLRPKIAEVRVADFPDLVARLVADGLGWSLMVPSARAEFRAVGGVAMRCFADDPLPRLSLWLRWRGSDPSPLVGRLIASARDARSASREPMPFASAPGRAG